MKGLRHTANDRQSSRRTRRSDGRTALITGGAGFIGTNVASRLVDDGYKVVILDSLGRAGVQDNIRWLERRYGAAIELMTGDIRDEDAVRRAVFGATHVFHFAAQVAVTTSLDDPLCDFDVNARGTLTLLEAIRSRPSPPSLVFTSTNKVYGALEDIPLQRSRTRYVPLDSELRAFGIGEERALDFHSPYGCSKGAADQYVLDYARTFGLPAVVFRMSCIYGPHQHGTEDQGWVAHFLRHAIAGNAITIYGDGCQVRDVLFVDDLVDAMLSAQAAIAHLAGHAFNIGGGPGRTLSLLELIGALEKLLERPVHHALAPWRAADQRYYVSDSRRFAAATGWTPRVGIAEGLARLHRWLLASQCAEPVAPVGELAVS
jgi:CDP-paratose 2-epimerase